ncbi:hypothetical protein TNCV_2271631 [Trichonephila clavipes]|nr:hypothetical protein TNCV_2271631 [Trichonephila clavipes]
MTLRSNIGMLQHTYSSVKIDGTLCRLFPNSIDKFLRVIVGSMETTNHQKTWDRLVNKNLDNSSHKENDEPGEGSGRICCPNTSIVQITMFFYSTSSRRPQRTRTCDSCTVVYQHIFLQRCVTTPMFRIPSDGLCTVNLLLGLHAAWTSIPWISSSEAT